MKFFFKTVLKVLKKSIVNVNVNVKLNKIYINSNVNNKIGGCTCKNAKNNVYSMAHETDFIVR